MVTKAKVDNLSNRKYVLSKLFNNQEACQKLFNEISSQNKDRNGGYIEYKRATVWVISKIYKYNSIR